MDRQIIYEYEDALAIEKATEEEIQQIHSASTVFDKVRGSNPDFPYNQQGFSISGIPEGDLLSDQEKILQERLRKARGTRIKAESIINDAPLRIQRIIQLKILKRYSWTEVAEIMKARSGESIRAEFKRWMKK